MKKIFNVIDIYSCDGEDFPTEVTPYEDIDSARQYLADRLEWYKKETYIEQLVDEQGNFDLNEFDEDCGDCADISPDSVDISYSANDLQLSLYIEEKEIRS